MLSMKFLYYLLLPEINITFFFWGGVGKVVTPTSPKSDLFLLLPCFTEIPVFNANSADPDSVASDQGLHCLPMSLLLDTKHKWVKTRSGIYSTCLMYRHLKCP